MGCLSKGRTAQGRRAGPETPAHRPHEPGGSILKRTPAAHFHGRIAAISVSDTMLVTELFEESRHRGTADNLTDNPAVCSFETQARRPGLVVKNHGEKRAVHPQPMVIADETQVFEFIHEKIDA